MNWMSVHRDAVVYIRIGHVGAALLRWSRDVEEYAGGTGGVKSSSCTMNDVDARIDERRRILRALEKIEEKRADQTYKSSTYEEFARR